MTSETDLQANTPERKCAISSLMRRLSLKHKVVAVIMLTCVLALSLVGGVLFAWERTILRSTFVQNLSMHAQVLAENCKAALTFGDRADAMQVLQTANAVAPIMVACVYTADGGLFAAYSREGTVTAVPPADQLKDHPVFEKGFLVLTRPVLLDDEKIGVVCLKASLDFMRERLKEEAVAILGVLLLSSLFACLISSRLQRIVSRPILHLADVARSIAENKQYTLRAEPSGDDEVGLLIRTFNEMLEQIQQRDAALTAANEHLETRVRERTAELSSANTKLAYLASFPEQNPSPIMEVDLDGNIRYANPATLRFFPDLPKRGTAHPWLADWATVARPFLEGQTDSGGRDVTIGGRTFEEQFCYFAHDRFVRIYGSDITERERAEEELRESEARFRSLMEQAGDGFELLDAEGRYVDANSATCRQLRYSKEELLRMTIRDVDPLMSPATYSARFRSLVGQPSTTFESVHRRKDRTAFPVEVTSSIIRLAGVPLALSLVRDITERKRAEQSQTELLQRLEEINQELKDFAYVVSHDLKAPLRAISTIVEWLSTDYTDRFDAQGVEYLMLLTNRVGRMQNIIDGVLQYSRIGRTEQEKAPVDLNQLVPQIVESLGAPGHISIHIESGLPTIEADVTRITQVFQNLLSNAIKYMDKPQGNITVACVEEGAFWKFSVADNGPGIEQKHFDRIFKLFQTLAPRDGRESTGVGLTIVKKIVEMYGGKIWVESHVGQGSTFFFTLPKLQTEVNGVELETVTACTR
jgi:PAS domain S-box-containing protein